MTYLFISDLHLSPEHPRLIQGFLNLLTKYQQQNTQLYILGDWFNAWVGDDYRAAWLDEIVTHLQQFTQNGNQIFFQVGNRDFALNEKFLHKFGGHLLAERQILTIGPYRIALEHGDALCTDDLAYQRFKKIIRHPAVLFILRQSPLAFRLKLVRGFRQKSMASKQLKSYHIMDVNTQAVAQALQPVDLLIHGHTHRPAIHHEYGKQRIVLGDWRQDQAQILEIQPQQQLEDLKLSTWHY